MTHISSSLLQVHVVTAAEEQECVFSLDQVLLSIIIY